MRYRTDRGYSNKAIGANRSHEQGKLNQNVYNYFSFYFILYKCTHRIHGRTVQYVYEEVYY
jgi:hypothetical protein